MSCPTSRKEGAHARGGVAPRETWAMDMALVIGTSPADLGRAVARLLGIEPVPCAIRAFPDGELDVTLKQPVRGLSVHVLQATGPPVGEHLLELLLVCDACWRAGARAVTILLPYFGFARQDRRTLEGQPLG